MFVTNVRTRWASSVRRPVNWRSANTASPAGRAGWLARYNGIAQMFEVIEQARRHAIATPSTGYLNALQYAKSRVQGADLTQMTDKTAPCDDHTSP